jgi:hypothetical protein
VLFAPHNFVGVHARVKVKVKEKVKLSLYMLEQSVKWAGG